MLAVYTGVITLCVGGLCCYHSELAVTGKTTNEAIRGKYNKGGNPYDEGCRKNMGAFLFGGTSRVFVNEPYNLEYFNKLEPNVFVIKSRLPARLSKPKNILI